MNVVFNAQITVVRFFFICSLVAVVAGSHSALANKLKTNEVQLQHRNFILPNLETARVLSFGYEQLLADFYWLTYIQYIGNSVERDNDRNKNAYKYLDLVTGLDPNFVQPYWFAAFTVGSEMKRPDLAKKLIDRGIQANQNNWYLPYIAGINQYLFAHNEVEAAKYYRMAAKFPDAPKWLGRQAQILEAKIPSQIKVINTWDTIYRTSDDPLVKQRAREHLATSWMKVFKLSPSEEIRKRARTALSELGVEVR